MLGVCYITAASSSSWPCQGTYGNRHTRWEEPQFSGNESLRIYPLNKQHSACTVGLSIQLNLILSLMHPFLHQSLTHTKIIPRNPKAKGWIRLSGGRLALSRRRHMTFNQIIHSRGKLIRVVLWDNIAKETFRISTSCWFFWNGFALS